MRGALSPDAEPHVGRQDDSTILLARVQIPVIVVQSTEDLLVNSSNVDPFITGRNTKHLWSHQLNILPEQSNDRLGGWVGKLSSGPADYQRFSILGKVGVRMVLDTLKNPRGAFVLWNRSGHAIYQENKTVLLDLIDLLACPTDAYCGIEQEVERNQRPLGMVQLWKQKKLQPKWRSCSSLFLINERSPMMLW